MRDLDQIKQGEQGARRARAVRQWAVRQSRRPAARLPVTTSNRTGRYEASTAEKRAILTRLDQRRRLGKPDAVCCCKPSVRIYS